MKQKQNQIQKIRTKPNYKIIEKLKNSKIKIGTRMALENILSTTRELSDEGRNLFNRVS